MVKSGMARPHHDKTSGKQKTAHLPDLDRILDGIDHIIIRNSRNVEMDGLIFINQPHGSMRCSNSTSER